MQTLEITLPPGAVIYSQNGAMAWMSEGVRMSTRAFRGGILGAIKRSLVGESWFLNEYTSAGRTGRVAFSTPFLGKILPVPLENGYSMICQKQALLAAEDSVKLGMFFRRRLSAGLFGGEGFILQRLTGPGMAFVALDGEIVKRTLEKGELLRVNPGHVAMFEPSVRFDAEIVQGLGNLLFSSTGAFLATLRGPGNVWLQTTPIRNLAKALAPYFAAQNVQRQTADR